MDYSPLLDIQDLHTDIEIRSGVVHALSGVDLYVNPGETLGIVGESGSGKTMTALSLMGLLPQGGRVSSGSIFLDGQDLTKMPLHAKRKLRGTKVGMIFQDPLTSLNPTMKIGLQVCEPLRVHKKMSKKDALERAVEILKRVGMPRPEIVINNYPHQLSGGMRQRVMIAMALVCEPRILIADEPTTALDVTTQMQILDLIDELRDEYQMGVILITHAWAWLPVTRIAWPSCTPVASWRRRPPRRSSPSRSTATRARSWRRCPSGRSPRARSCSRSRVLPPR